MRWLFHRTRVAPVLLILGLCGLMSDDWSGGLKVIAFGLAYWWIGGLLERRGRNSAVENAAPAVRAIEQVAPSDGFSGAFSRLDPRTQAWLRDEFAARQTRRE